MRARRIDGNQNAVVADLRKLGFSVAITSMVGNGFPDIVVGYLGGNYMFELKDPDKPPSKRKLTTEEQQWHDDWRGQVSTVQDIDEILLIITAETAHKPV